MVILSCFVHSFVKDMFVIGLKGKDKHIGHETGDILVIHTLVVVRQSNMETKPLEQK